jgi:hypothetical protein
MLNKGLTMPCVKCNVMGYATNLVLTPNHFIVFKVMNELVNLESKRKHINLLFILHFNFNKLEALLL